MSVTVPASVVQKEEQRAARQLASRARMKGFRKGRVPAKVIESRYGGALRREALDKLIGDAYREALAAEELRPISEGEVEDVQYQPEQDLTFAIAFDVEPVIDLERLGGFAVERSTPPFTDEHLAGVLARIQEQNGVWQPVEEGSPEDRDLVSVTILKLGGEEVRDGEGRDYDFVIGQGDAIPDIDQAIKSLEPGAAGDFDVTFPDDFPDESRRGDTERIRITLTGRRMLDVPELDDDLAKQVGDFETLDELKAKVRGDMEKEAAQAAEGAVRQQAPGPAARGEPLRRPPVDGRRLCGLGHRRPRNPRGQDRRPPGADPARSGARGEAHTHDRPDCRHPRAPGD